MFAIGSVRGAPGVTTTALLLAGCFDDGIMVEADLDGGVTSIRYGLGREPGLTTLAAAPAIDGQACRQHAQNAGGVPVVVGPDAPDRASALWTRAGEKLGAALAASQATVVVDAGRFRRDAPIAPVLRAASLVLVLLRPEREDLVGLSHRLPGLHASGAPLGLVLVGQGTYTPADISREMAVDVVGTLPVDRRALSLLTSGGGSSRFLRRTPLGRATRTLADDLSWWQQKRERIETRPMVAQRKGSRG